MVAAAGHSGNFFYFFVFLPGSGQDSITGFEGANGDVVDLRGYGLADFAALQRYISQVGSPLRPDTVINFNNGDILTLKNVFSSVLVADDFVFV
jgi:hypothetical protein